MPFQIIRNDITKVKADAIVNTANPEEIIALHKRKFGVDNETTDIRYDEKRWTEYIKLCREYREDSSAPSLKDLQNEEIVTKDGFAKSGFIEITPLPERR